MKKFSVFLSLLVILSLLMTSNVRAQTEQDNPFQDEVLVAPVIGSALLDYAVYGIDSRLIGGIDGLVLDIVDHQILYIVVDTDNLFGGDRLVPWQAFQVVHRDTMVEGLVDQDVFEDEDETLGVEDDVAFDPEAYVLVLPVTEEVFDTSAPEFDDDLLDDPVLDIDQLVPEWDDETVVFWSGYVDGLPAAGFIDADTELLNLFYVDGGLFDGIDFTVIGQDGNELGELEEIVIQPNGSIPYGFIETDAFLDIGDELVVVRMPALLWSPEELVFLLNVEEGALENAPRFDSDGAMNFTDDNWDDEWNVYWIEYGIDADEDGIPQTGTTGQTRTVTAPVLSSTLLGHEVQGTNNNTIGGVQGLVINGNTGQIPYLIVESDELFGEDRLIPWGAFQITPEDQFGDQATDIDIYNPERYALLLPVTETAFDNAPGFDAGLFDDDLLAVDWDASARRYWSGTVTGIPATGAVEDEDLDSMIHVEESLFGGIDYNVIGADGNTLGEIENLIINARGQIQYALVETDAFLDIGDELVVVSMPALNWLPEQEEFSMAVEEGAFENAPRFDPNATPDFTREGWDREWRTYWTGYTPGFDEDFDADIETMDEDTAAATQDSQQLTDDMIADLVGERAYTPDGVGIANVSGVVYGPEEQVAYVNLYDQPSSSYILVPWSQFDYTDNRLVFTGDLGVLEDAPAFHRISQIDMTQPGWDATIKEHWGLN